MATENTTSHTLDGLAIMTNGAFSRLQKQRDAAINILSAGVQCLGKEVGLPN